MQHPIEILERYWNFTSFKPKQEDIIEAVLNNEDVFALLPTGGGKSLCFQIPALAREGICIVISPLIALMKDQVEALKEKGIKAMALTSAYSYNEVDIMLDNCIYGNYKFLYLSPERLQQDLVQGRIRQMNVNLIAVDEAHCISQWGNDFRPAYKNISILREYHPSVNILALTASARPTVVSDIIKELDFIDPKIFKQSFKRANLGYMVYDEEDKYHRVVQILLKQKGSAIVYVRNRKSSVQISSYLLKQGISSIYYHGGLTTSEKNEHFKMWKTGNKQVIVATNAFGMGIDKADVSAVIHVNLPESLESYFQEAGRAGRNDESAHAIILKNKGDESHVKNQFLGVLPSVKFIKDVYKKLCSYFQISFGEGEFTTHDFNFSHFCKRYEFNSHLAFNAIQILDRNSIISISHQFQNQTTVQVLAGKTMLFKYMEDQPECDLVLKSILRTYGGIFDHQTKINTVLIANKTNLKEDVIISVLTQLEKDNIIALKLNKTDSQITFLEPREDDKTINRITKIIDQQNKLKHDQISSVIEYINDDQLCRSRQLLRYFGEKQSEDCGICSVCIERSNKQSKRDHTYEIGRIVDVLSGKPLSSREIMAMTELNEKRLTTIIKLMLEKNLIQITETNTYKLKNA